jgi:hypothetical protein
MNWNLNIAIGELIIFYPLVTFSCFIQEALYSISLASISLNTFSLRCGVSFT